jgi:hypothetical protein
VIVTRPRLNCSIILLGFSGEQIGQPGEVRRHASRLVAGHAVYRSAAARLVLAIEPTDRLAFRVVDAVATLGLNNRPARRESTCRGIDVPGVCDQRLTPETPAECVKAAEQAMLSLGGLGLRAVRVSSLGHGSAGREPRRKAAKAGASDLSSSAPAI